MSRILIHLRHGQRIDRTGFHAIPAKHAFGNINVKLGRIPLQRQGLIFFTDDLDAPGRTGYLAEVTPDAPFLPIVVPQQAQCSTMRVRDRSLFTRILEGHRTMKHVLERDLHRFPDFAEQYRVQ